MEKNLQKAAVLIPCIEQDREKWIILTRRTERVDHHKGQVCFPGGASDPQDETLWQTALRETEEEIGIAMDQVRFIKELSPRITPSGFYVTPFVGEIITPVIWRPNENEIAEIFNVPLSHLRDTNNLTWVKRHMNGLEYLDPLFRYEKHEIWGLTGRILCEYLGHPFPKGSIF